MDDWEPAWRARGVGVLQSWIGKLDEGLMRRMGVDKLLVDSMVHTLSLNANPPLRGVLEAVLDLVRRVSSGEKRAERYAEIVDKSIVQGWTYAPSGLEGRAVLIHIAGEVEILCKALGSAIVRWLKVCVVYDPRCIS
jgi:hypothetical protein